ncbi:sigma-54 dependent transcriptional regulator [Dysgonomonas sp. 25]|uniref:sigma-54-dependent transcriptional regulator n=1 Tax=Dysgonomonas sp. 25 TaxID=2302933 RepID=UPI0013D18FF1|nr:sigma-54 dependent transcriptional regulator [Dysgonomonas sp. 25]NDV68826.1 sigma-54-dependent Fis family transcriptional regulator [Dysgonomonas sp. 25]
MDKKGKILIIDDNEDILFALNALLAKYTEKVKVSTKPENALRFMSEFQPDIILLDMNFSKEMSSGKEGFFWLEKILQADPNAIVIMMTAYADTDKAVQAIKAGATDFIPKPWEKEKLLATINSAMRLKDSQNEVAGLKKQLQALNNEQTGEIIGESEQMQAIFDLIERMSATEANILILGENGTGKDLVARTIHNNSPRAEKVFATIDLGSISESLFESELFGHEKGAFTDAKKEKQGRIEVASGGTLFLDEIGNLSPAMQAKLLTTIEKKYISRLGSVQNIAVDVRFIAATNTDIYKAVEDGLFRQDLLYRINTIEICLPPLRERGNDIILLADFFLNKFGNKYKKEIKGLSLEAKKKLTTYNWPGNVRELQNVIERAVILSQGRSLQANDFNLSNNKSTKLKSTDVLNLEELEQQAIEKALALSEGNMNKAAEMLGISRFALYRKINKK